jgi:hypothetical protein
MRHEEASTKLVIVVERAGKIKCPGAAAISRGLFILFRVGYKKLKERRTG